ncbi:hypothetical protein [Nakamurella alba]|nr:hypothetical protein [Nakamurella alba]
MRGVPRVGDPGTHALQLDQPLGGRIVADENGQPYRVTVQP